MKISEKRKAGDILGRDGISERIILIAKEIAAGSHKEAIDFCARCLKKGAGEHWTNPLTQEKQFTCNRCNPPKTYDQGRAEMRDECLQALEGLIESKYYRFDSSYHVLREAITKIREPK